MAHERDDAALEVEGHLPIGALVDQGQLQTAGQVGRLAEPLDELVEVVVEPVGEDLRVGQERGRRAVVVGRGGADRLDRAGRHAAAVLLPVELAVAPHLDPAPLREGVHDRGAHAVQTAGDFVAAAAELAAGVEDRHDHFQRRLVLLGVLVDRDTAAVVGDGHHAVGADAGHDRVGMTAQRLVDRVVDDLAHEVMQPAHIRAADIHTWAAADGFQSLEHLDGRGVVGLGSWFSWSLPPFSTPST